MSKLREAAQAVIDRWQSRYWTHDAIPTGILIANLLDAVNEDALNEMQALTESEYRENTLACLSNTHQQLGEQLGEQFDGQIWPDGTALYVKIGEPGVKFREQEPKIGEQPPQHWDQLVANLMRYGMTKSTAKEVATGLMAMGWRRCAEGQKETQHCALLEAAVLAEREACAQICEEEKALRLAEIIRARGEHMTDRELLEAAAKAAGLSFWQENLWNPLVNDGDALRLAVKLELQITVGVIGCRVNNWNSSVRCIEESRTDLCAATRRAIIRAAAEIGRLEK